MLKKKIFKILIITILSIILAVILEYFNLWHILEHFFNSKVSCNESWHLGRKINEMIYNIDVYLNNLIGRNIKVYKHEDLQKMSEEELGELIEKNQKLAEKYRNRKETIEIITCLVLGGFLVYKIIDWWLGGKK